MKKCFEKREFRENQVRPVTFVEVNNSEVGIVTNISQEGFVFRYIENGDVYEKLFQESLLVTIIHAGYVLYKFPCKSVIECYSLSDYFISTLKMNKCCLYFSKLTQGQKSELEFFIANCTEALSTKL